MKKTLVMSLMFLLLSVLPAHAADAKDKENNKLPNIHVLATGGTIAGAAASTTQLTGYQSAELSPEQLIAAVPALTEFANIKTEQIAQIGSQDMTVAIWLKLAKRINELLASPGTDGIVITHGTDTMEETAYFLNLVVKNKKPVVLVGSLRPATALSADGPLNLLQAVAVAGSKDAAGRGVLVVLNGEINGARDVTKTQTSQVQTFQSRDMGLLGWVKDNKPVFYRMTTRKHTTETEFDVSGLDALPKVEILYNYVDPGIEVLEGMLAGRPEGIVSAGTGAASLFTTFKDKLTDACKEGLVVILSSRTGSGMSAWVRTYQDRGFLLADNLNPQKARVLLMLALTKTKDPKEIARIFATY